MNTIVNTRTTGGYYYRYCVFNIVISVRFRGYSPMSFFFKQSMLKREFVKRVLSAYRTCRRRFMDNDGKTKIIVSTNECTTVKNDRGNRDRYFESFNRSTRSILFVSKKPIKRPSSDRIRRFGIINNVHVAQTTNGRDIFRKL